MSEDTDSISLLDLSVRAGNCLESARISTISELVQHSPQQLLAIRSFGKTALREVRRRLEERGLSLAGDAPKSIADESPEFKQLTRFELALIAGDRFLRACRAAQIKPEKVLETMQSFRSTTSTGQLTSNGR